MPAEVDTHANYKDQAINSFKEKTLNTISSRCLIQALGQVQGPHGTERESSVCETLCSPEVAGPLQMSAPDDCFTRPASLSPGSYHSFPLPSCSQTHAKQAHNTHLNQKDSLHSLRLSPACLIAHRHRRRMAGRGDSQNTLPRGSQNIVLTEALGLRLKRERPECMLSSKKTSGTAVQSYLKGLKKVGGFPLEIKTRQQ